MRNDDIWASKKLSSLEPAGSWHPDADRALARLHDRRHARRARLGWLWGAVAAVFMFATLIGLTAPRACAQPSGCRPSLWSAATGRLAATPAAVPNTAPQDAAPSPSGAAPPGQAFKQSGPADAPLTLEVFSDYQCPQCREFYLNEYQPLLAHYSGKVKFIHRDFPLIRHDYAKLAARYANAAGPLGRYEDAVKQIYATQEKWAENGKIDEQLGAIFPADVMQKIRAASAQTEIMDRLVEPDMALAAADGVRGTPTLIVVKNGFRHMVIPVPPLAQLEAYIDGLMGW